MRGTEYGARRNGRKDFRTERGKRSAEAFFRCDNQCSEKTLSFWQLASVVVNEGVEAYTTNLCQKCFNKHLQAKGGKPLSNVQWRQVVEKKAYRGRMWKMMGKERTMCTLDVGILSPRKKQGKEVS